MKIIPFILAFGAGTGMACWAQKNVSDKVSYNKINVIKNSSKKEKYLLPHQQPGFKDDCARYLYWYYVQLIHQHLIKVPAFKTFMDSNNFVKSIPKSPFEEFRKWEAKYRPNLYCNALVDDYLRIILKMDIIESKEYRHKPKQIYEIYSDYEIFEELSDKISYEKIQQGNVISYGRNYFYFKAHANNNKEVYNSTQLRQFSISFTGHTAIITDVIWRDDDLKIAVFVTLNKPGDFYSLMLYDEKNDIFIEDFDELMLMYKTYYQEITYEYLFPLFKDYEYCYYVLGIFPMFFKSTPFYRASLCDAVITEVPNFYYLFEWTKNKRMSFSKEEQQEAEKELKQHLKNKNTELVKPAKTKEKDLVIFYRNYLHNLSQQDTNIKYFIRHDNYVTYFPCFFSPYSRYDQKMSTRGVCMKAGENFVKTLYRDKIKVKPSGGPAFLHIDSIRPLSEFYYTYNYDRVKKDYKHHPEGRCVNSAHYCMLVDVYAQDPAYKIAFLLTYNYPGKYYALFMYDYEYQLLIPDFQRFYYVKLDNQKKHKNDIYYRYFAKKYIVSSKFCKTIPLADIFSLFTWYEKKKIKEIYRIVTNKQVVEGK
ncbi:MAG: hypothetical protein Fur0023_04890 [Bacteroidia bacterium]